MSAEPPLSEEDFTPPPLIAFIAPIIIVAVLAGGLSSIAMQVDPTLADIDVHIILKFEFQMDNSLKVGAITLNNTSKQGVIILRDELGFFTNSSDPLIEYEWLGTEWHSFEVDITEDLGIHQITDLTVLAFNETGLPSPLRLDNLEFTNDPFEDLLEEFDAEKGVNIFDDFLIENSNATIEDKVFEPGNCFEIRGLVSTTGNIQIFPVIKAEKPEKVSVTPVEEEEGNEAETALLNALIYVFIVLFGGFLILFLIRSGMANILQSVFAFLISLACLSFGYYFIAITFWYFLYHLQFVVENVAEYFAQDSIFFSIVFLGTFLYAIAGFIGIGMEKFGQRIRNALLISFGAGLGAFLGLHFPLWSTLLVLIALALYDIYAVFRGPIKGIIEESDKQAQKMQEQLEEQRRIQAEQQLQAQNEAGTSKEEVDTSRIEEKREYVTFSLIPGLPVYQTESITIGLGDFAFYSLLIGHSALYGLYTMLLTSIGILIGAYITFRFLERKKALPGLPVSIFIGIIAMLCGMFLFGS